MNVGQNGDPDDRVRFGYLWGLNGGEAGLPSGGFILYSYALVYFVFFFKLLAKPPELLTFFQLARCG